MVKGKSLLWKIPVGVVGGLLGLVILLLVAVGCVLYVPSLRQAALEKGLSIAREQTGMDIDIGDIYLSPFHHSPMVLYRAYKGQEDLPLRISIDSLFVGHRGQDTLLCARTLRLSALAKTSAFRFRDSDFLALPIVVDTLQLDEATFHSDSMIASVGIDAIVGHLSVHSPELVIARGQYPLHGLRLNDAYVGIDLRETPPDTTAQDTTPLLMAFDVPDGELRNIHFALNPLGLHIRTKSLSTNVLADVGGNLYDARRLDIGGASLVLDKLNLPIDTLYGEARVDLDKNLITSRDLHTRSDSMGVQADLSSVAMNLESMRADVVGDAAYKGSMVHVEGYYDIDDEAYDIDADIRRVNLRAFMPKSPDAALSGTLHAEGQGIDIHSPAMKSRVRLSMRECRYDNIDASGLQLQATLAKKTVNGTLHLPIMMKGEGLMAKAQTDHTFRVADFLTPERMQVNLHSLVHLSEGRYDNIDVSGTDLDLTATMQTASGTLHLPITMKGEGLMAKAQTDHLFRVTDFMTPRKMQVDLHSDMTDVEADVSGEKYAVDHLTLDFATAQATSLDLSTEGLTANMTSPMHVLTLVDQLPPLLKAVNDTARIAAITSLRDLTQLDYLRRLIPDLTANISLRKGSPIQHIIDGTGLDINEVDLALSSDAARTNLAVDASIPDIEHPEDSTALRLPAARAGLRIAMREGSTNASLTADSRVTDGAMSLHGLRTDANLWFDLVRKGNNVSGAGRLTMDDLRFGEMDLGSRCVDIDVSPSALHANAIKADVQLDDLPLDLADSIIRMADLDLSGTVRARATADGLPSQLDLSAEVLPLRVSALYKPYNVQLSLGETPIVMQHNKVDFNGLPIYGADSTYIALNGGLNLNTMLLDVTLRADSFAPAKLEKNGSIPVYGDLATDIRGTVTGPLDKIVADVDVTLLPVTDITYPIDKKNLAQVRPHGTVRVRYDLAENEPLSLGGQINVDEGFVRYSPKAYPIMPFRVDSGSYVAFNGPIGRTRLHVSASQKVKADVQSQGEETRRVDFRTGVRVNGVVDSIGLKTLGFFLEAPDDETITHELASLDEETREGLAATLLATGMYVGESNEAQHQDGYALSAIINSRINAALANSKAGKVVDIDFSNAQTEHAGGKTNDMNITISKSFFKDRFRITIGSTLTDNPEVNQTSGLLSNLSAEYKLTKDGDVLLRAFADRDYNNVLEGELYKTGLGVRATKDWRRKEVYRGDSISRVYSLTADAGVAYRSNNSIGPDLTLKSSIRNLMGHGETFTLKGNGAYYWALRNRHPGDPKKTDTYKFGLNASLVFPYLHWTGENNPDGDTRYMLGYQYENIAGGYGVHKLTGSFTYFIHSTRYITHAFTPFSLSVVMMRAESDSLLNKAAEYPQLIKVIAGNEFVPSIGYTFTYNDYRAKRAVNTLFEVGIKESGNILNGLFCLFGHKWDEPDKKLGSVTFNQFVKMNVELMNKFNFTDQVCIATRLYAGANIPLGNSYAAPLSEGFYAGGPNNMRGASPYAYGPGNFYSEKYNQNFFHSGDVKLEANLELRFPIVWKLYGAAFLDAGNVWNWYSGADLFKAAGITDYKEQLQLRDELYDGLYNNPDLLKQIALGTGAGLRLDLDGLVIRLDIGVAIHAPYQTYKYDKKTWQPDKTQPITAYYNIPSALDAIRVNFGIGYPF
ncbi:MAG: BamA/TamA family outer membrane protein [Paludibacteraceae bacterium]|nr:BamA/TamA family outer membrane protein [Paludibacteraceae bacterium]